MNGNIIQRTEVQLRAPLSPSGDRLAAKCELLERSDSDEYLNHPDRLAKKFIGVSHVGMGKGHYVMTMKPKNSMEPISLQGKKDDVILVHWLFGQDVPPCLGEHETHNSSDGGP